MTILVTGATGHLGGAVLHALRRGGIAPSDIVAAGRRVERLAELARAGFRTARVDADQLVTLTEAFEGAGQVLLVSVNGNPRRVAQHRNIVDAARSAGVGRLVYTSYIQAATDADHVAHHETEQLVLASGIPYVILRNGVYDRFFVRQIPGWLAAGEVVSAASTGRVSSASIDDLAEAAANVLTADGHNAAVYELGCDVPFTIADLVAEVGRCAGAALDFVEVPAEEFEARLVASGHDPISAVRRTNVERAIAADHLYIAGQDLSRLLGRPTTTIADAVAAAVRRRTPAELSDNLDAR